MNYPQPMVMFLLTMLSVDEYQVHACAEPGSRPHMHLDTLCTCFLCALRSHRYRDRTATTRGNAAADERFECDTVCSHCAHQCAGVWVRAADTRSLTSAADALHLCRSNESNEAHQLASVIHWLSVLSTQSSVESDKMLNVDRKNGVVCARMFIVSSVLSNAVCRVLGSGLPYRASSDTEHGTLADNQSPSVLVGGYRSA